MTGGVPRVDVPDALVADEMNPKDVGEQGARESREEGRQVVHRGSLEEKEEASAWSRT